MFGSSANQFEVKKRNKAAIKVQNAFRCRSARERLYNLYRSRFIKIYDFNYQQNIYKNKKTQEFSFKKPRYIYRRDIPITPNYDAPADYDSGNVTNEQGYFFGIICSTFPLGNWPGNTDTSSMSSADLNVNGSTDTLMKIAGDKEYEQFEKYIKHDYICKFREENVLLLKNPTTVDVLKALERLKKIMKNKNSFLVSYISTHIITVIKGEKKTNPTETCYFAFKDSVWSNKPMDIAESCISLTTFCEKLNQLKTTQKTILLNYAHIPKPKPTLFASVKLCYPTPEFLISLSNNCKSVVIGSCTIGTYLSQNIKHYPISLIEDNLYMPPIAQTPAPLGYKASQELLQNNTKVSSIVPTTQFIDMKTELEKRLLLDWQMKPDKEIIRSNRPAKPVAKWDRKEEDNYRISIDMPTTKEKNRHSSQVAYWMLKRTLAKPVNLIKGTNIYYRKIYRRAPYQTSLIDESKYNVFSRSFIAALKGGACLDNKPLFTARELYLFIYNGVKKSIEKMCENELKKYRNPEDIPTDMVSYNQSPVIIIPNGMNELMNNPVCYQCSPPPAPERPYITNIGLSDVSLEWYNPSFEGIPPTRYRIEMRNITRNYSKWQVVYYPGDITLTLFTVKNLPTGIACQFRVVAYNSGGWGSPSEPTIYVVPGEDKAVLPDHIRWKRLAQSGPLGILDRLLLFPYHRDEHYIGNKYLLGFAQINHGFKNSNISLKIAKLCLESINETFPTDFEILSECFQLLGWCLRGKKSERKVRNFLMQNDIVKTTQYVTEKYRFHGGIVNNIMWLRSKLEKQLPPMIDYHYKTLIPQQGDDHNESDDDDSNDDNNLQLDNKK
eukprot:gene7423-10116_t